MTENALQGKTLPRRRRTPMLLQMEAVECGAACLGIMLGYHGRIVALEVLRRECGVSRSGSKASSIVQVARKYGLEAVGLSKELQGLGGVEPPYIVFWNFNHFVVVEGFGKDKVFLNDPASGHRTVTFQEFDDAFTGIILSMPPGDDFKKGGRKPSVLRALKSRLKGAYGAVAFCSFAGFLLVIPGLAIPAMTQIFLDRILAEGRADWLRPLVLGMLAAVFAQGLLKFLQLRYLRRMRLSLSAHMSSKFIWHLMRLPANFYAQRYAGDISNRTVLNEDVANVLSGRLATTLIDLVMMFFYAALMFAYDPVLTLVGIAFAVANFGVLQWISRRRVEANMKVLHEYGKVQGVSIAAIQSMETIKASGQEDSTFGKWAGFYAKAANARQDIESANRALTVLPGLLTSIATMLVLVVGGLRVMDGVLTIGMLVAFQSLMWSFLRPVNSLVSLGSVIQELQGDMARLDDVLAHPHDPNAPGDEPAADRLEDEDVRLQGHVEMKGITFGYSPLDDPLIEDFDLSVEPGRRVALVGGSGSGKSTMARIVCGLYEPWKGELLFDGQVRSELPRGKLHNSLSLVDQDVMLFEGTVRENLTLWDDSVPDSALQRACEDADIYEFVASLPGGLDAMLSEGASNMSGGQRQRLEIARALVNNPTILVLDEATSALDAETEKIITDNVRLRGCTCIVIAHRLSTIRDCDEIIVLSAGKVVERGTHEQLWEMQGQYAQLLRADEGALLEA